MLRRSQIPRYGARVILWDNNKDHDAHHFEQLSEFFRALRAADDSGKGFRIAYSGEATPDYFELWSRGFWSVLDGRKPTYGIIEEYSDCCRGAGLLNYKKDTFHRRLWTQSRKYYGILHATSQRPQLISKDSLSQAGIIWAGSMDTSAADRIGREIDVNYRELMNCNVGEFFRKDEKTVEKIKVFTPI